jgi:nicotinamidase-related amidase
MYRTTFAVRGALAVPGGEKVVPAINRIAEKFENMVLTQDWHRLALNTLFFVGLAFDFCVHYSAEDARKAEFVAFVIEEACRGIDLDGSIAATHQSLKSFGILTVGIEAFF